MILSTLLFLLSDAHGFTEAHVLKKVESMKEIRGASIIEQVQRLCSDWWLCYIICCKQLGQKQNLKSDIGV